MNAQTEDPNELYPVDMRPVIDGNKPYLPPWLVVPEPCYWCAGTGETWPNGKPCIGCDGTGVKQ